MAKAYWISAYRSIRDTQRRSLRMPNSLAPHFKRQAAVSWRVACPHAFTKVGLISGYRDLRVVEAVD
jgi:hypothetical protein